MWNFRRRVLAARGSFHKTLIEEFWRRHEGKAGLDLRKTVILELKKYYHYSNNYIEYKFSAYQLAQRLLAMGDQKFQEEFNINDEEGAWNVDTFFKEEVHTEEELHVKAAVAKNAEWSTIGFKFSDDFRLDDISDDIVAKMLDNIENRVLWIYGLKDFIIIHRISDKRTLKSMITKDNKQDIEQLIQQCNDDQVYDVILRTDIEYQGIGNIRIRYLNYINSDNNI